MLEDHPSPLPSSPTQRPSRRAFLHGLAAVGGAGLVLGGLDALGMSVASAQTAPPALRGSGAGKRVVILGAGLAGMTAAYELSKLGYECTLIEARGFAGGRCQTARAGFKLTELGGETQTCEFDEGQYINHGPWRIPFNHQSTLHYTKEFGVPLEVMVNDNDASYVMFEGGKGPLAGKPVRKAQVAADMRGHTAELLAKAVRKDTLDTPLSAEDKELFVAYLTREGYLSAKDLSYSGTPGRGYDVWPGALTDPGPGKPSTPFAMTDILHSNTWRTLRSVTNFTQQRTMFQPVGGMDRIAQGFADKVGHMIRYSTTVERIGQDGDGVEVAWVDGAGQRGTTKADYCICTIPLSVLRHVDIAVPDTMKKAIAAVAYEPTGKIGLQMKRRFWEEDQFIYGGHVYTDNELIGSISLPSTGWQGAKGTLMGYYQFEAAAVKVSAMTLAERAEFAVAFGQKVFPQYRENVEKSFSVAWHRVQHSLGGWAEWSDEARRTAYPVLCEPAGRIYLAGEHLSYLTGWQAGAIESAWLQAAKLHRQANA